MGFLINAFATQGWMVYAAMTVGALQGLAYPSMQALLSRAAPADAQGELQGGIASLMSVSAILGPLLMTQALAHFSVRDAPVYFPGAAFILATALGAGALLVLILVIARSRPAET
jgi:MFS transporter, DHA1 family, tetracycline resistance protein